MATAAHTLTVTMVERFTPSYFRFRTTRPEGFRFQAGQFVMIGLPGDDGKPIMRAYSIANPTWDEELAFYSIVVPDGELTPRLQHIEVGSEILMSARAVGTLTLPSLRPGGRRLYMLSTGTGIAPFISLIREEDTYDMYDEVILTHTCRGVADLQYGFDRVAEAKECPLVGEEATAKLRHYATATREDYPTMGRITDLIENGKLFSDLGVPPLDPEVDRVMICGSMDMLNDLKVLMEKAGMGHGTPRSAGEYSWEKAFAG